MLEAHYCYPRLLAPTTIHVTPRDGLVQSWTRIPIPGTLRSFTRGDFLRASWLNQSACSILKRCTGEQSATGILDRVRLDDRTTVTDDACWTFLMAAQRRGFIEFRASADAAPAPADPSHRADDPLPAGGPVEVRLTGSLDAYWPLHASVELTKRCNLRCVHCYAEATPDTRDEMPTAELLRILAGWSAHGMNGVELTGGEPMLHPDFWTIVDACLDHFFTIAVLTNGTLVDEAFVRRVAAFPGRISVGMSLDGSTAERHDAIRGKGSFEKTSRAIRMLAEARCRVRVGMTAGRYNIDDVEATGAWAEHLGATLFAAAPVMPFGRAEEHAWQLTQNDWARIGQAVEALPRIACVKEGMFDEHAQRMGNCGIGITNVILSPAGQLKACLFLGETEQLADLRTQSLEEVFTSDRLKALSALRAPEPATCAACSFESYCRGCIARGLKIVTRSGRLCQWAQEYNLTRAFPTHAVYPVLEDRVFRSESAIQSVAH